MERRIGLQEMRIGGMAFVKEWGIYKGMAHQSNSDHKDILTVLTLYINEITMTIQEEIDQITGIYHILLTELTHHH